MTKHCNRCNKTKDITEFGNVNGKGYRDGKRSECKSCGKLDRERHLGRLRQIIYKLFTNASCLDCGESDPVVFELDHVRGEKVLPVSVMVAGRYSQKRILDEIQKCEIVCANCHRRRTAKRGNWHTILANKKD